MFDLDGLEFWLLLPLVTVPLAVWKLIDIVIWLFNHVQISFK